MVANLINLGEQWGISIKAGDVDNKGASVCAQFNMNLLTHNGIVAQTSVNCHPTTTTIHIQLNKSGKVNGHWQEKVDFLSVFMYETLDKIIQHIEETQWFHALRDNMQKRLDSLKENDTNICVPDLLKSAQESCQMYPLITYLPTLSTNMEAKESKTTLAESTASTPSTTLAEVQFVQHEGVDNRNDAVLRELKQETDSTKVTFHHA